MPNITYNTIIHYHDGVKRYEHRKDCTDYECWREYDEKGNEIHAKDTDGVERWSDTHPDNPKNKPAASDSEPFTFGG